MLYTTLNKIRSHAPCKDGWEKLLQNLGKTQADDEQLSMLTILNSNGLDDALWCLRACDGIELEARLFAGTCVRRVRHLMTDPASINALAVAWDAAIAVEAGAAAWGAAWGAAGAAAGDAAEAVAAGAAARGAAWAAARAAERAWQEQEFKRVFCGGEK